MTAAAYFQHPRAHASGLMCLGAMVDQRSLEAVRRD